MNARAALVCYRNPPSSAEWTIWDTADQARLAESELTPCDDAGCIGVHSVVTIPAAPARRGDRPRREVVTA